jgi:hypothetical protein
MTKKMKRGQITFTGDQPMQIDDGIEQEVASLSEAQQALVDQIGATIKEYLKASDELLHGRYVHLKDWAPVHLADRGNVLIVCCPDGVVVRFERKADEKRILAGWMQDRLPQVASLLSQNVIQCYADRNYTSTIPTTGTLLQMYKEDTATGHREDIVSARIGFDVVLELPEQVPQPPHKPFCLLSVRNTFEVQILGELLPIDSPAKEGQPFLARGMIRLQVGWECIEIFPFITLEHWKPEYAPIWAENDLLAAVAARQFREAHFQSLDPYAAARRQYSELLKAYKGLLDSNPEREETLQVFLRDNPMLLSPTQIRMWPKLALGAHKTDFVFQEASGDYLLVELERSTHVLFLKDGGPSRELNHARDQIVDWKRYIEDNLSTVQRELGLTGISANPRSLLVIGRTQSLSPENRRKLVTLENESPKLKIMTYDDVYENAKAVVENLLGPIWDVGGNTQIYYLQGNRP